MWLVCPVTFIGKDSILDLIQGPCLGYWHETFLCVFSFMNIYIFLSESVLWVFLTTVIIAQTHQMQEFPFYLEDTQLSILPQFYLSCHSVTQLCLTPCNPIECSPPEFSVHGILQARIQEWVAIAFSRGPSWSRDQTQVFCIAGRFFTNWATREALFYHREEWKSL